MSAHQAASVPVIDFIIALNRVSSICRFTIDVPPLSTPTAAVDRLCIMKRRVAGAKIIAGVAVVSIDAGCIIFGEESILAHVFVDGLNLAVFALVGRLLLLAARGRYEDVVVGFILGFNYSGIDRR